MKKWVYIGLFVLFGILTQFLVHAIVEITYIALLIRKYEVFGLGLSFDTWFTIHAVFAAVLFIVGAGIGYRQGVHWWKKIYGKSMPVR